LKKEKVLEEHASSLTSSETLLICRNYCGEELRRGALSS